MHQRASSVNDSPSPPATAPDPFGPVRARSALRRRRRRNGRRTVVGAALAVGFGAGAAAGFALVPSTAAASPPRPHLAAEHPAPARSATPSASPSVSPLAMEAIVLKVTGSGTTTTQDFLTGPDWSLYYKFDCGAFGGRGNFIVTDELGPDLLNVLAVSGTATVYEHGEPGSHALEVNSECSWTLTVTNGDSGS